MKKSILLSVSFALVLTAAPPVQSLVVDAPHNTTNNISCGTCHSYSLWWQYSPTTHSTNPDHTAIVDAVCMTCHDGSHEQPLALSHASSVVGTLAHGTWGVGCTECHNPHSQEQLSWVGTSTTPYLVTGTIASVSYAGAPLEQTTITFTGATTNSNWPVEGIQGSDPDWANKSVAYPDRGLILVHDTSNRVNSFAILSATPSQVVVKGRLPAEAIDPNFVDPQTQVQNPATCNTFGLIYGQLIKSTIASKPVKFFDPNGGFVQEGAETTGICQVCHTQTSRYTANGILPTSPDTHADRSTTNCMGCHPHSAGIGRGTAHDLSAFAWAGNCATCHNAGGAPVNIVTTIHNNDCAVCHVAPSGGGPLTAGDPANGVDGTAVGAVAHTTCLACHITVPGLTESAIHHTSASGYAAAGACTPCHQDAVGKLPADHTLTVAGSGNCASCHAQAVGTASGAPVDPADATIHDACTTCHETSGPLKGPYGKASAMPAGGGSCEACHGAYFNNHTHSHQVAIGPNDYFPPDWMPCSNCHSVSSWPNIMSTHLGQCSTCHSATRDINTTTPTGTTVPMVIANPQGTTVHCLDCHQSHFAPHAFTSDGNCGDCHTMDYGMDVHSFTCGLCHVNPSGGGPRRAGTDGSAINGVRSSTCTFCHDTTTYPPGVVHHDTADALSGNCTACHFWTNHGSNHTTLVADSAACNSCHPATAGNTSGVPVNTGDNRVHDACTTCHATNGTLLSAAVADNPTTPATVTAMVPGACEACHGSYFTLHSNPDHAIVRDNGYCGDCHQGSPATNIAMHGPCSTCHAANGTLTMGPQPFPDSWSLVYPGPGACDACHGNYFVNHISPNHAVSVANSASCSPCHPATGGTLSGIPVNVFDNKVHDACSTCHNTTTGALLPPYGTALAMPAGGGSCEACHGPHHALGAHDMPQVALCLSCHTAASPPYVAVGEAHAPQGCATCHNPTDGALIGSAAGKTNGASCETCHNTFSSHPFDHTPLVRVNSATTPTTANCGGCHPATISPFAAAGQAHAPLGCSTCHSTTTGALIGSAINHAAGGECATCHEGYFTGHNHGSASNHDLLMRQSDLNDGMACNLCHRRGGNMSANPLFTNTWSGADGILALHQNSCDLCHNSARATNLSLPYASVAEVIANATQVGCLNCHADAVSSHPPDLHDFSWVTSCESCHGIASTSLAAPKGEIGAGVHSNACVLCHQNGVGGAPLIGSAANATVGVKPHPCSECHTGGFDSHSHGSGNTHDVLMRQTDLYDGSACNTCHRRDGTSSGNPQFTNAWPGSDGILALHQNSCALCHSSTRTTDVAAPYTSINHVIIAGIGVGCLTCHNDRVVHPDPHQFAWDGGCNACHSGANVVNDLHKGNCTLCHVNPGGGGTRRAGSDGNALLAINGQPATCLTCHPTESFPSNWIHHDTTTAANNNCTTCHPAVDHSLAVIPVAACSPCHPLTAGTTTGMPVDMTNSRIHDACRSCHTFNATTLAGQLVAPSGSSGVTAMAPGLCTTCHTVAAATLHHDGNRHALVGECEYCHADPRNLAGRMYFQETAPGGGIPTHLPCAECHVKPKLGATVNGWTATAGQMTIYAFNEGGSHSTTDYSSDFNRTIAHSGGHTIANTAGQINNWGICFSCHDTTTAVWVKQFHAKPTALVATNNSCGNSGTARYAPGREARNTIGNFDFFASTFRPASTRPGGSGTCRQPTDWSGATKYGTTNFPATDLIVPDPWSTATNTVPMFSAQTANTATTPMADNVKVTSATWDNANIVVTATNTDGCVALTAVYNGSSQPFTGTTTCTATFPGSVPYTPSVPTISVTTSNADGFGVSGYRIRISVIYY